MGFHLCEYCYVPTASGFEKQQPAGMRFLASSSGDVVLLDESTNTEYTLPDMALHYVADHHWLPPEVFVDAVMGDRLKPVYRLQTKSLSLKLKDPVRVSLGYLHGVFPTGEVPCCFVDKLEKLFILSETSYDVRYRI